MQNVALIIYAALCAGFFIMGAIEGWQSWHETWDTYVFKSGGPFTEAVGNGLMYALLWPMIVALVVFVVWAKRRQDRQKLGKQ